MIKTNNYLMLLKIKDLIKMLKHVRLGKEHLQEHLQPKEFKELLAVGDLHTVERANIESDTQEKVGNVALVLNTILTSSLGAWLGFVGFSGLHLHNIITVLIVLIALTIGATIGRLSYRLTQRQAIASIINHKLFNIEFEIINTIVNKRAEVIKTVEERIVKCINYLAAEELVSTDHHASYLKTLLQDRSKDYRIKENLDYLISHLEVLPHKIFYARMTYTLLKNVEKISDQLATNIFPKDITHHVTARRTYSEMDLLLNTSLTNASYIRVLTKSDLPAKRMIPKARGWLRKNFLGILVGLLPTIMGGFASMFVFLDGIPDILKAFGLFTDYFFSHALTIKTISLSCAFCITSYLGYSNIHTNYKAFRRTKQLELAETKITEAEEKMMQQVIILNLMIKLNATMKQLKILYKALKMMQSKEAKFAQQKTLPAL